MNSVTLKIGGMGCGNCVQKVNTALAGLPGTRVESVTVGSARLAIDPGVGSTGAAVAALARIGFDASVEEPASVSRDGSSFARGGCCRP